MIANQAGTTVWRNDNTEPFGYSVPNGDPGNTGSVFDLPLRLLGQYFDRETNLHYNYFRDYDPSLGIYKQSDPIGLRGGLNTYVYVSASPLLHTDSRGLAAEDDPSSCPPGNGGESACCPKSFLDCLTDCIRARDPLGDGGKAGLSALGGTLPKSVLGLSRGLGGASPVTTVPSAIAHGLGGGTPGASAVGAGLRTVGRICSPIWVSYGLYLSGAELLCATECANNHCSH